MKNRLTLAKLRPDADNHLFGKIQGIGLTPTEIGSLPATSRDGKTYLKIVGDPWGETFEAGAAYPKIKDGMEYYSVTLDSPIFPAPINAALFPDRNEPGAFNLVPVFPCGARL